MPIPLGLDFPTAWARKEPARAARDVFLASAFTPFVRFLSSMEVRGSENLAYSSTMIFTPNHVSHLDTVLVLSALPTKIRRRTVVAAAIDTFFVKAAKATQTVLLFNAIPVDRHKINRRSSELALELIADRWNLLIYPEGGRTTTGDLEEFKGGAAYLSERTGAVVIPTFLLGAGELMGPKYAKAPQFVSGPNNKRHHVVVAFGPALRQLDGESIRKFNVRIHEAVAQLGRDVSGDDSYGRVAAA
jgi:1-acyl-sn-glycerol-3-phosphate acyltransferase